MPKWLPLLIAVGLACAKPATEQVGPAPDTQGEEAAIRAQETHWRDVIARKDTAAIGSFYTQDGIYAPTFRPMVRGRDAVAAMWATHEFTLDSLRLERTPIRIDVARSGDVATEVGTWVFHGVAPNRPVDGAGSYVTAWRKEGGVWKISAYMWNLPEAPPRTDSTSVGR
ncbi:MAG TPA: nuclear transport factor 2 family protein [Gemmatimonadales bacterium]|nr:nuclear transport factor 2 family protein [Gemmatimonadales bacterium]